MARKKPHTHTDELPDLCGRQAGRTPAWWKEVPTVELDAAHERARCLRAGGYGAVIWGESSSSLFDDDF